MKGMSSCPKCGSNNVQVFDFLTDVCMTCKEKFPFVATGETTVDRLTSALTSAKEEIERLKNGVKVDEESRDMWYQAYYKEKERAESAESSLASERKETERLREALEFYAHERIWVEIESDRGKKAKAALQERQGEE